MTDRKDLQSLASRMREHGAEVTFLTRPDGRLDGVQIANAKGIGPHTMGLLSAAERMREWLHDRAR